MCADFLADLKLSRTSKSVPENFLYRIDQVIQKLARLLMCFLIVFFIVIPSELNPLQRQVFNRMKGVI